MKTMVPFRVILSFVFVLALGLGVGCRTKQSGSLADGGDYFDPLRMDGTYALGPRGEFGQPIEGVTFENVSFAFDSFQIPASERRKIQEVADYLLDKPGVTVLIDGHCDERGSREYNLSLGEHRALSVRAVLISMGVSGDRIHTRSFGSEMPLDARSNEEAWAKNRRGEFTVFRP